MHTSARSAIVKTAPDPLWISTYSTNSLKTFTLITLVACPSEKPRSAAAPVLSVVLIEARSVIFNTIWNLLTRDVHFALYSIITSLLPPPPPTSLEIGNTQWFSSAILFSISGNDALSFGSPRNFIDFARYESGSFLSYWYILYYISPNSMCSWQPFLSSMNLECTAFRILTEMVGRVHITNVKLEISKDLSISKRPYCICHSCYCWYEWVVTGKRRAIFIISSCNSVLFNVTEKEISKLQGVQNCLARVVTKSHRFCHITHLLKSLHWLPARYRIKFKLCSLTYQALTSGQPVYIRNMLQPSRKVRTLRSSDLDQLNVPRVRTAVGSRAFSVAAPRLWNELPLEFRSAKTQISFRKKLKTYLFGQAFPT